MAGASLLDAAKQRLALWDVPDRDIERLIETGETRKTLTLYAPSSGAVTHLMVREGMEVAPNTNLYTIADLSRVWVYANVYEYELPWIKVGQQAIVEISYLPGQSFEGTVTHIDPFLDRQDANRAGPPRTREPKGALEARDVRQREHPRRCAKRCAGHSGGGANPIGSSQPRLHCTWRGALRAAIRRGGRSKPVTDGSKSVRAWPRVKPSFLRGSS